MASRARATEASDTWTDIGTVITRAMPIDDVQMRPGRVTCDTCKRDATGRMVDAYMVPFGEEAEINDQHGRYFESYDPAAFNRRLEHLQRARAGLFDVGVYYNHGMSLYSTPVGEFSVPLGHPAAIRADGRGVLTSTHYGSDDFAERILTGIKDGNIGGQSFTGRIIRSDPERVPRARRGGELPHVRRLEMGLTEYGPTPMPYFAGTPVVAVRSQPIDDDPVVDGEPGGAPTAPSHEDVRRLAQRRQLLVRRMLNNR